MKNQAAKKNKKKVGVGPARIKSIAKEIRKRYGPTLKRLAG
jgi:hypothetical protein